MAITFVHDDGGRASAGFRGSTGDCVTRAIAIATGLPYRFVYDEMAEGMKASRGKHHTRGKRSARDGVFRNVYEPWLLNRGWIWTPTMEIGSGCKVHLRESELPSGRLIVSLSRHVAAVIDGALHDTADCSRNGTRCVYGYYRPAVALVGD